MSVENNTSCTTIYPTTLLISRLLFTLLLISINESFLFQNPTTKKVPFGINYVLPSPPNKKSIKQTLLHQEKRLSSSSASEIQDITIIGGGISGLAAGITIKQNISLKSTTTSKTKLLIIEKDSSIGGRVQSDKIYKSNKDLNNIDDDDGNNKNENNNLNDEDEYFICDKGFAVFIENYPMSQKLLNYESLELCRFLPGALIYKNGILNKIADPIRYPSAFISTLFTSITGSTKDKLLLLPLIWNVYTKSIDTLFTMDNNNGNNSDESEIMSTYECLSNKYQFSDNFILSFWSPFLKGIYFSDLNLQSSSMFHFALKMFIQGYVSLPKDGMQGISNQLLDKLLSIEQENENNNNKLSVDVLMNQSVCNITKTSSSIFEIQLASGNDENKTIQKIQTKKLILATDVITTKNLLSNSNNNIPNFQFLNTIPNPKQNEIICMYYTFNSHPPPITEPLLILIGQQQDNEGPINNLCFPSVVNTNYAPHGHSLCSISILPSYLKSLHDITTDTNNDDDDDNDDYENIIKNKLDILVRKQLSIIFPNYSNDILESWELLKFYKINNAQSSTYEGMYPANINGGRDCTMFYNQSLPENLYLCGDYMATASFNGALESGVNAGMAVVNSFDS